MSPDTLCMGCMGPHGGPQCPDCGYREGTSQESPLQLAPRTVLNGRYLLGRVLGQGGFGITYLAYDLHLKQKGNQNLAIKEYFPSAVAVRTTDGRTVSHSAPTMQETFQYGLGKFAEEGHTLMHLRGKNHPNIVEFLDFFKSNGTGYIVMKYVDGITLLDYLRQEGDKIPFQIALNILVPVMDALRTVHGENIWHRDVSPDNIYITKSNVVKILDFGSTRQAIGNPARSQQVFLKGGYSPEEQYRTGGHQGPWTDVYALAATCYRCITGKTPPSALDRLAQDDLEPPSRLGVHIPERSEAALMKALAVRAPNRFQTISEFQRAITPSAGTGAAAVRQWAAPKAGVGARVSKNAYLALFSVVFGFAGLFLLGYNVTTRDTAAASLILALVCFLATFGIVLSLAYKMWACIQDGHARMTPAKAVGFCFIPLFNLLWAVQVFWGFAKDYNRFLDRHHTGTDKLPEGLFLAFPFLGVSLWFYAVPVVGFGVFLPCYIVGLVVVSKVCDAVNALPGRSSGVQASRWPLLYCVSGEFPGSGAEIPPEGLIIGRSPAKAQLVLSDPRISNAHARLWCQAPGSGVWLEDLRSRNGTFFNPGPANAAGRRWAQVRGPVLLMAGARFRLGEDGVEFEVRTT